MRVATIKLSNLSIVDNIASWDGVSAWNPPNVLRVDVTGIFCGPGFLVSDLAATTGPDGADNWRTATFTQPEEPPVEDPPPEEG